MAIDNSESVPLYVHTLYRILREMRTAQQEIRGKFNYCEFKNLIMDSGLTPTQLGPLNQRLDALESFMPKAQVYQGQVYNKAKNQKQRKLTTNESVWDSKVSILEERFRPC